MYLRNDGRIKGRANVIIEGKIMKDKLQEELEETIEEELEEEFT